VNDTICLNIYNISALDSNSYQLQHVGFYGMPFEGFDLYNLILIYSS
jgi:hypothetical protein